MPTATATAIASAPDQAHPAPQRPAVPPQYAPTNGSTPRASTGSQAPPQVTIELPPDAEPDYQPPPIDLTADVGDGRRQRHGAGRRQHAAAERAGRGPPLMRTYGQAKEFAQQQHRSGSASWHNMCQMFSRQCVGAPSFGSSAREAFNRIPAEQRHTSSPPPAGSIAYYGFRDHGFGHAVFAVSGGFVWSNDILRTGHIDRVRWDVFPSRWRLPYRGWISACPGGELPVQDKDAPPTYRQGRRVYGSRMRFAQDDSDSVWNLQVALAARGFEFENGPTGYYGVHTRQAVAVFQRRRGWTGSDADGIAGPGTVAALGLLWVDE